VTLRPSEPDLRLRLHAADGSAPVACNAACTVSVRTGVLYKLAIVDRHGVSARRMYFWQPESVVVTPPNRTARDAGAVVLIAGITLFTVSSGVFLYGAMRNLSLMECETDCDAVSSSVIKASLIGMGASFASMLIGGGLVLANGGPSLDRRVSRVAPEPSAMPSENAMPLGAQSQKRFYEPFVGWRVTF
jgi:hypothetical protein